MGWTIPGVCFEDAPHAIYLGSCRCFRKSGWKLFRLLEAQIQRLERDCKDLSLSVSGKFTLKDPSQQQGRPLYSHQCSADHLLDKLQFGLNVQFFNLSSCAECWFLLRTLTVMVWAGACAHSWPSLAVG